MFPRRSVLTLRDVSTG